MLANDRDLRLAPGRDPDLRCDLEAAMRSTISIDLLRRLIDIRLN
jgi:hypothetical protein